MKFNKSQASLETVLIFGFAMTLVLLMGSYYVFFLNSSTSTLDISQQDRIFNDVLTRASEMYYNGNGNRITIDINLPDRIENITINTAINGSGVEFDYINVTYVSNGEFNNQLFFPTDNFVRLNCSYSCSYDDSSQDNHYHSEFFSPGPKRIRVESKQDVVLINFYREE